MCLSDEMVKCKGPFILCLCQESKIPHRPTHTVNVQPVADSRKGKLKIGYAGATYRCLDCNFVGKVIP